MIELRTKFKYKDAEPFVTWHKASTFDMAAKEVERVIANTRHSPDKPEFLEFRFSIEEKKKSVWPCW